MLRILAVAGAALAALHANACLSSTCDHPAYCDGNTLVSCGENEEDVVHESRYSCEEMAESCVHPAGVKDAFCSWSTEPLAACEAQMAPPSVSVPACNGNQPVFCLGGFPTEPLRPEPCDPGTTCIACGAVHPVRDFAGCGLGRASEPLCTATALSACDASEAMRFDCTCGWRTYEAGCIADCVSVAHAGTTYGLCTFAAAPDARCGAANDGGDSGWCDGDLLTECFLGYPVRRVTCQAGMCIPGVGPVLASCRGLPVSTVGLIRGGVGGL